MGQLKLALQVPTVDLTQIPTTAGGQTAASQQAGHDQLPRQGATSIQGTQISAATPQPERQTQ